jgi:PhnB protein
VETLCRTTHPRSARSITARSRKDPVGNIWWIQTHLEDVDDATMRELFADPQEAATMRHAQESFAAEMRRRL